MISRIPMLAAALVAAEVVYAQQIPIRTLSPASATTSQALGSIVTVREVPTIDGLHELPGGRVLVNDQARRQLVVFDTELAPLSAGKSRDLGVAVSCT